MAQLDLGDGSGTAVLTGIVDFLSSGGSVTRVLTASLLGTVVAPFVAVADIISAIGAFFATPFTETAQSVSDLAGALFQAPAQLLSAAFGISQSALATFLGDSLAGILAGPVAVGLVLLSLYLVVQFRQEAETGDTIPGLPVDVPTDFLGSEEEAQADE